MTYYIYGAKTAALSAAGVKPPSSNGYPVLFNWPALYNIRQVHELAAHEHLRLPPTPFLRLLYDTTPPLISDLQVEARGVSRVHDQLTF